MTEKSFANLFYHLKYSIVYVCVLFVFKKLLTKSRDGLGPEYRTRQSFVNRRRGEGGGIWNPGVKLKSIAKGLSLLGLNFGSFEIMGKILITFNRRIFKLKNIFK